MDCPSGEALGPAGSGGLAAGQSGSSLAGTIPKHARQGIGSGGRGHQLTRQKKREQRASRALLEYRCMAVKVAPSWRGVWPRRTGVLIHEGVPYQSCVRVPLASRAFPAADHSPTPESGSFPAYGF